VTPAGQELFIRAHTRPARAPLVPEFTLHLATEITPIWQATEDWLAQHNIAPPFWAFAWPGSQALARFILDNPATVAGRRVLDFAAGSGLAALAAARAGAAWVEAAEIDPLAIAAIALNAHENAIPYHPPPPPKPAQSPLPPLREREGPSPKGWEGEGSLPAEGPLHRSPPAVIGLAEDIVGAPCRWDLILCGDICYEAPMTRHLLPWLKHMANTSEVWIADPGRAYLPADGLKKLAVYRIETSLELENQTERLTAIYRLTGE
jgi:predicted nicotinamide N-methyase